MRKRRNKIKNNKKKLYKKLKLNRKSKKNKVNYKFKQQL